MGLKKIIRRLIAPFSGKVSISYQEANDLARDKDPEVRQVIAANAAPLGQVDLLLATDPNVDVRASLARKIARLSPGLAPDEQDTLRRVTFETLEILIRDQTVRVRQVLSNTLKDIANAPQDVINRLARDVDIAVSAPILRYSPVLSEGDLLEIIESKPVRAALTAISKRENLTPAVSDLIVDSDDTVAITTLLGNQSAQIREETLDWIVDRAPSRLKWHAPLVRRTDLSSGAVGKLAKFVADDLLDKLSTRKDLDPAMTETVRAEVHRRLAGKKDRAGNKDDASARAAPHPTEAVRPPVETPREKARRLHGAGSLNEKTIISSLIAGDGEFGIAALAELSGLPWDIVKKVINTASGKGMTAVVWRAGLSMEAAVKVQQHLLRLRPADLITPTAKGDFPLSDNEMKWQIDFFSDLSGR